MYLLMASNDRNQKSTAETESVESMEIDLEAAVDRSTTTRADDVLMEDATACKY